MKKVGLAFSFVFAALVSCASAQDCSDCLDPKPVCPQYQEPTCNGGTWVCPDPICDPWDRRICEEEWCGTWDDRTCTCDVQPGGCGGCDPRERDRCYQECNYSDRCWDDQLCYCWPYRDVGGPVQSRARTPAGHRRIFLGRFPPRTACEGDQKIPTSLAMDLGEVRIHNGGPLTDHGGGVLEPHVWGTSRLVQWGVRDQDTALFRRGDMLATEWVTQVGGLPASINLDRTVAVPDGVFGDIYALVRTSAPGLRPGEYSLVRQIISIHWAGSEWYEVLRHCVKITYNDVIPGAACN